MEPEAIDDAQLLSAIERAWPVPPMTGQLINRDISNLSIEPQTGSFSAPLAPLPRFQPRRTWSSLTRIAAVLALLLTSVFGVIAFNNRSEDNDPGFSIAAPSPYDTGCPLPARSRGELLAIVTETKARIAAGEDPSMIPAPIASTYELIEPGTEATNEIESLWTGVFDCAESGTNPYTLRAYAPRAYTAYISSLLNRSNQSIDAVMDELMRPIAQYATPEPKFQWEQPAFDVYTTRDGRFFAAEAPDIFGNGFGTEFTHEGGDWQVSGYATLRGEWSSLSNPGSMRVTGCPATSTRSDELMSEYLEGRLWKQSSKPLVTTLPASTLTNPTVSGSDQDAIERVVENYRQCLGSGISPYRFAESTEQFFGYFASFIDAGPYHTVDSLGLADPNRLSTVIPSATTSIVSVDTTTATVLLTANPEWASIGKMPAIILVNVDGQWLINQLAIVQGPSS